MKTFIYACISIFIIGISSSIDAMQEEKPGGISIKHLLATNEMPGLNDNGILDLSGTNISSLDGLETVSRQQEILGLYLSYNLLQALPPSLFPNLFHLDISYNPLQKLPEGMLEGLVLLKHFIACNAEIEEFPPCFFNDLPRLTKIDIAHNRLTNLQPLLLRGCTRLIEFNLSYNQLTSVPAALIHHLTALRTLNLKGNTQQLIPNLPQETRDIILRRSLFIGDPTFLENEPYPKTAQVLIKQLEAENRLSEIFFKHPDRPNYFIINLAHRGLNNIDRLAELLPYPGLVIDVRLQNNYLEKTPCETLNKFGRLKFLELSNNQIRSLIQTEIAQNDDQPQAKPQALCLPRLKSLRLGHNCLEAIPENALFHLTRLSELQLSHNNIELIEDGAFGNLENLEHCHLDNNNLGGIPLNLFASGKTYLHKLQFLDLSHNKLGPNSQYTFPPVITMRYFPQSAQSLQILTAKKIIAGMAQETPQKKLELLLALNRDHVFACIAPESIRRYLDLCTHIGNCSRTFDTLDPHDTNPDITQQAQRIWLNALESLDTQQWDEGVALFLNHFAEHPIHQKFLHCFCENKIKELMSTNLINLAEILIKLSPTLCDLITALADENLQRRIQETHDVYNQHLFLTQSQGARDKAILLAHGKKDPEEESPQMLLKRIEYEWSQSIERFKERYNSWSSEMQHALFELVSKKCKHDLAKHGIVLGDRI